MAEQTSRVAVRGAISAEDLRAIPALQKLPERDLERLAGGMTRQVFEDGQVIFLEGEPTVGLWFVVEGHIKIVRQSTSGRVQALCMMNRGSCFGTCPLFSDDTNPASAEAVDRVTMYVLPRARMDQIAAGDPAFSALLLRIYGQRLVHLSQLAERLGSWRASDRINDCLLAYAAPTDGQRVVALTHEKLATLAGTVREVVTRHLADLEKDGVVRVEPERITLLDTAALTRPCLQNRVHR